MTTEPSFYLQCGTENPIDMKVFTLNRIENYINAKTRVRAASAIAFLMDCDKPCLTRDIVAALAFPAPFKDLLDDPQDVIISGETIDQFDPAFAEVFGFVQTPKNK